MTYYLAGWQECPSQTPRTVTGYVVLGVYIFLVYLLLRNPKNNHQLSHKALRIVLFIILTIVTIFIWAISSFALTDYVPCD
jgi:uncharacterized membrane protein